MSVDREFILQKEEQEKMHEWLIVHNRVCPLNKPDVPMTAIGGRFTYCFTPTGLGVATIVQCACGAEVNVTSYEDW